MQWILFFPLLLLTHLGPSNAKIEKSTIEKAIELKGKTYQCNFILQHNDEESVLDIESSSVECNPTPILPMRLNDVELEDDEGHIFIVDFQMSPGRILEADYVGLTPQEEFQAQEVIELDDEEEYPCYFKDPRTDDNQTISVRGAHKAIYKSWPNGIIPYVFDHKFNKQDRLTFAKAIQQIEANTCVRFRPRRSEKLRLKVMRQCNCKSKPGPGCFGGGFATYGASSAAKMVIGTACLTPDKSGSVHLVMHELLHSLGIAHTQVRPDRGNFIWVYKNRIQPSGRSQFKMCTDCKLHGVPYDCKSIMHYRDWAFAINRKNPVMVAKNKRTCDVSSPNHYLTKADNQMINAIYGCQNSKPIHGRWSWWSVWSTCKSQSQYRYRLCNSPKPANGGRQCTGNDKETRSCTTTGGGDECPQEDTNTKGRKNQQIVDGVESWADCASLCLEKRGCTYWTWHHEEADKPYALRCVLMEGYSTKAKDTNAISGSVSCATTDDGDCPELGTNTRGRGHSQKMNTNTWQECAAVCKKISFCTYWTWHHEGSGYYYRRCIIMAGFGNKATDSNAISGSKKCLK